MFNLYADIDQMETQNKAKKFLQEYRKWKLEVAHFHSWVRSSNISIESEKTIIDNRCSDEARAELECALRTKTIEQLATIDDRSRFLSDLLYFRYINSWTVIKVCSELSDKYDLGYMAERTYTNHLHEALWSFAVICPRNLMVKK